MKLSVMLTPLSDINLALAAQAGADGIVVPYPGLDPEELLRTCRQVEAFGLRVLAVERRIPHSKFVHNLPGRDEQIQDFVQLIRNVGEAGIPILCYNWMPDDDWQRTALELPERGGARVTGFDMGSPASIPKNDEYDAVDRAGKVTSEQELWENLDYFLQRVLPVAEASGVKLAMHPDDPPITPLRGQPRILTDVEGMERLLALAPSPANGICFCQGTFASRDDVDIVDGIRRLGPNIVFVHFRDVLGGGNKFRETFIDNGKTDMAAAMRAYLALEHSEELCIRPDHVPTLQTESNEHPGYETLGRLHALGYMKGLIDASQSGAT